MDENQPFTTYRRDLLNPLKKKARHCFLRGPLEWVMEVKKVNVS